MTRTALTPRHAARARQAALACAALLLAACTTDSMVQPLPEPEPEPVITRLVLDFNYIEVIRDCDGIEGDGDFSFRVRTARSFGGTTTVYNRRHTLGPGGRTAAIGRVTTTTEAVAGKQVTVELRASEEDHSLFRGTHNDDRLDNAVRTLSHSLGNSGWSRLGPQSITVGSGECLVRLHYTASAE